MNPSRRKIAARIRSPFLTRRAAMRGILGGGLATAFGIDLHDAVAQRDAATPAATPGQTRYPRGFLR